MRSWESFKACEQKRKCKRHTSIASVSFKSSLPSQMSASKNGFE